MADLTVKDIEIVRELPGNPQEKGGPAKVVQFVLEGDDRKPELFTVASTKAPKVGDTISDSDLEWSDQWNRWQIKKKDSGKGGGGRGGAYRQKMDPTERKQVQRQHSAEMALRREANLIAGGQPPFSDDELRQVIDWFEADIDGKIIAGVTRGPMTSDVPGNDADLPWAGE